MKHLFENRDRLTEALTGASSVILLLDYDGTLTPIVSDPRDALLDGNVRELLTGLNNLDRVSITIISGRSLEQLDSLLGIPGIALVANHGFETRTPSGEVKRHFHNEDAITIREARDWIAARTEEIPGAFVEYKGAVIALHYRNVPGEKAAEIEALIDSARQKYAGRLRSATGKMVFELKPATPRDKGTAALDILNDFKNRKGILAFYVGDDTTDEDAFRVLKDRAWTVFVGEENARTAASYRLESPAEVAEFLKLLLGILEETSPGKNPA